MMLFFVVFEVLIVGYLSMTFDYFCWMVAFDFQLRSCLIILLLSVWWFRLIWLLYFERDVIDVFFLWSRLIWQPRSRLFWFTVIILLVVFYYSICIAIFLLGLSFSFTSLFIFVILLLTKLHFLLVDIACIRRQNIGWKVLIYGLLNSLLVFSRLVRLLLGFMGGWRFWWFWEVLLCVFFEIVAIWWRRWWMIVRIVWFRRDCCFKVFINWPYVILIDISPFLRLSLCIGICWVFIFIMIPFLSLVFRCSAISSLLPPIFLPKLLSLPYFQGWSLIRVLIPRRFQILSSDSATDLTVISPPLYVSSLPHIYVMIATLFNQLDSFLLAGGLGEGVQVFFVLLRFQILHLLVLISICIKHNHRR